MRNYLGYPSVARTKDDVGKEWEQTKKAFRDTNTRIEVLLDIQALVKEKKFTAKNGEEYFNKRYPEPKEIREKIDYRGLSEAYIFDVIDFDEPKYNWAIDDPELTHYFTGDSTTGIRISQDEEDPRRVHAIHSIAYGGPNIYIDFILKFNYEIRIEDFPIQKKKLYSPGITEQSLEKVKFGYDWWGNGAVIDITSDPIATKIYEDCFEERITWDIEDAISSGKVKLENRPRREINHE